MQHRISHKFLAWLDQQKMLLRVYTQNIDTLEQSAGVKSDRVIYAHGSLLGATCMKCKAKFSAADIAADVQSVVVPLCQRPRTKKAKLNSSESGDAKKETTTVPPIKRTSLRRAASAKSAPSNDIFEVSMKQGLCCGVIKPNITFFGEKIGNDVARSLQKDYESADALIVMGTSLSV
jgi:NAD-dependent SIR2 family protein deacetylase